jgi:hypothetical protein
MLETDRLAWVYCQCKTSHKHCFKSYNTFYYVKQAEKSLETKENVTLTCQN